MNDLRRRRDEWLCEHFPYYRYAMEVGGENFKIRLSPFVEHLAEDRSPEFIAEDGLDSNFLAEYIAEKEGGDIFAIERDLASFFINIDNERLNAWYSAWEFDHKKIDNHEEKNSRIDQITDQCNSVPEKMNVQEKLSALLQIYEHEHDSWDAFQKENLKKLNIAYDPVRHEANVFFLSVFCTHILLGFDEDTNDLKRAFCQAVLEQQRTDVQDYICQHGTQIDITYYKAFKSLIEKNDMLGMGRTICELLLNCNEDYDPYIDIPSCDAFVALHATSRFSAFLTSHQDVAELLQKGSPTPSTHAPVVNNALQEETDEEEDERLEKEERQRAVAEEKTGEARKEKWFTIIFLVLVFASLAVVWGQQYFGKKFVNISGIALCLFGMGVLLALIWKKKGKP